jgi:uncharacterized protein (TIGR02145 family)
MKQFVFLGFVGIHILFSFFSCKKTNSETASNSSVTDASGNKYPTVVIGTQTWMAENLRTTKFRDGSNVPLVTDNVQWEFNSINNTKLPMMCWYNHDQTAYTANKYGALYNWHVINPASNGNKNICPAGWHVPSDDEWSILTNFLGGESIAGGKMKSVGYQHWPRPNTGATNSSGFSGFPGGFRLYYGIFGSVGSDGLWWSSTESDAGRAWYRTMKYNSSSLIRSNFSSTENALCIRCLKD